MKIVGRVMPIYTINQIHRTAYLLDMRRMQEKVGRPNLIFKDSNRSTNYWMV